MAGLTNAESVATLDSRFPTSGATDYIAWGNAGAEVAFLARTAIGATGWAAATNADPSIKANSAALTSAAATAAGGTVSQFAIYTASSGGTQRTDWTNLTTSRTLAAGDQLTVAIGAIAVSLT